jgi:hypothetical protein
VFDAHYSSSGVFLVCYEHQIAFIHNQYYKPKFLFNAQWYFLCGLFRNSS